MMATAFNTISTSLNDKKEIDWVRVNITTRGLLSIPDNFERHAPIQQSEGLGNLDE
jgi:hypothetical protein